MIGRVRAVSTPTALWCALWALVIGLLVFGVVGVHAATQRQNAVETVRSEGAPLVAATESLYVALADADAAASTAYLQAGLESPELRDRYENDIAQAAQELSVIGRSSAIRGKAQDALTTLNQQLPLYAADIESARTNNRLGFTVGAAYQRDATELMQGQLLPAATNLYETAAHRLDEGHRAGSSRNAEVVVVIAAAAVVALLVIVHVFLTARTRRLINVGLVGAAAIVVTFGAWAAAGLHGQRGALAESQREGSDPLIYLSTARILALRSLSDENVDLIDRPNEEAIADFDARTASIAGGEGKQGLLDQAAERTTDPETAARIAGLAELHGRFLAAHQRVRRFADEYEYKDAVDAATTDEAAASADLDDAFESEIDATRQNLGIHAAAAAHRLRLLPYMSFIAALAAAAAVAAGMWPRLKEYR